MPTNVVYNKVKQYDVDSNIQPTLLTLNFHLSGPNISILVAREIFDVFSRFEVFVSFHSGIMGPKVTDGLRHSVRWTPLGRAI